MTLQKKALITGVSGQDGSYLAELLLNKGYEVHGMVRRSSTPNTTRIDHILDFITIHQSDMTDQGSLTRLVDTIEPDEVYNLAAQSFVHASWDHPVSTADMTGLGVTRLLEAIRCVNKDIRFYQASSSEMFGKVQETPQRESTPFYPRSPYGASKVYGHWITVNYRESYDMFCCSGILFNHESNTPPTPVLIRKDGLLNVVEIGELAPGQIGVINNRPDYEIWDNGNWTKLTAISRYCESKPITRLLSRSGYIECTDGHKVHSSNGGVAIDQMSVGDRLTDVVLPDHEIENDDISHALAWVTGFFVGDGSIHGHKPRVNGRLEFFNKNLNYLAIVERNIRLVDPNAQFSYKPHESSYKPGTFNNKLHVISRPLKELLVQCYRETDSKPRKRVPQWIFNSSLEIVESFLDGYCAADGTKTLPNSTYDFQYYTTSSQLLATGLRLLCHWTGRNVTHNCERRINNQSIGYYHKGFIKSRRLEGAVGQTGNSGKNLEKDSLEVIKIWQDTAEEYVTITTESGSYSAGTGLIRIYNSPRRGLEFVTRKISNAVANIKKGKQDKLYLGNLESKRDWGFAGDYVEFMHLILQADSPSDYVVGSGVAHTVREFVDIAFSHVGLDYNNYVEIDPKFFRPAEVDILLADPTKAKTDLGWKPKVDFESLVRMMVDEDMKRCI